MPTCSVDRRKPVPLTVTPPLGAERRSCIACQKTSCVFLPGLVSIQLGFASRAGAAAWAASQCAFFDARCVFMDCVRARGRELADRSRWRRRWHSRSLQAICQRSAGDSWVSQQRPRTACACRRPVSTLSNSARYLKGNSLTFISHACTPEMKDVVARTVPLPPPRISTLAQSGLKVMLGPACAVSQPIIHDVR